MCIIAQEQKISFPHKIDQIFKRSCRACCIWCLPNLKTAGIVPLLLFYIGICVSVWIGAILIDTRIGSVSLLFDFTTSCRHRYFCLLSFVRDILTSIENTKRGGIQIFRGSHRNIFTNPPSLFLELHYFVQSCSSAQSAKTQFLAMVDERTTPWVSTEFDPQTT